MIYKSIIKYLILNNEIEAATEKWRQAKEKNLITIPVCMEIIVFAVNNNQFDVAFFLQQDTVELFCIKDSENFIPINCILSILEKELINNIPRAIVLAYLKLVIDNCKNFIAYYSNQSFEKETPQSSTNIIKPSIFNNDSTSIYKDSYLLIEKDNQNILEELQNILKTDGITCFLKKLSEKFKQKIINKQEYKFLLITPNEDKITPFHLALISNPETIDNYLEAIVTIENILIDYKEQYKALLTSPDKDDCTPLHYALKAKYSLIVNYYFSTLSKAIDKQIITKEEYKTLLIATDKDGRNPLHQALISTRLGIAEFYIKEINEMITKQIILKDEYKTLLTATDKYYCTPLHYAANSNNLELFNCFIQELKKFLNTDEIYDALYAKNINGLIPACETQKTHAKTINEYLVNLTKEHKSIILCSIIKHEEKLNRYLMIF